jgi:hypothetical protein
MRFSENRAELILSARREPRPSSGTAARGRNSHFWENAIKLIKFDRPNNTIEAIRVKVVDSAGKTAKAQKTPTTFPVTC